MIDICQDQKRFPEIIQLRALCWKHGSSDSAMTAKESWQDCLDYDASAIHWVINEGLSIVASARLNIIDEKSQLPYPDVFRYVEIPSKPFAFYSRLVVHPDYQSRSYSMRLDKIRLQYLLDNSIDLAVATARDWRLDKLRALGFRVIGPVRADHDPRWDLGNASVVTVNRKDIIL